MVERRAYHDNGLTRYRVTMKFNATLEDRDNFLFWSVSLSKIGAIMSAVGSVSFGLFTGFSTNLA